MQLKRKKLVLHKIKTHCDVEQYRVVPKPNDIQFWNFMTMNTAKQLTWSLFINKYANSLTNISIDGITRSVHGNYVIQISLKYYVMCNM